MSPIATYQRSALSGATLASALLGMLLVAPVFVPSSLAEDLPESLPPEIQASRRGGEGYDISLALSMPDLPVRARDDQAYSPVELGVDGNVLYAARQAPVKIRWDFGDGDSVLIEDRVSVTHRYADDSGDGTYRVTATISDRFGEIGSASHEITILNNDPWVTLAAVEIDSDRSIVEFSAAVVDAPADTFTYSWDFGDGSTETGDHTIRHQYLIPGTYEVELTVDDDDYGKVADAAERNDGRTITKQKVVVTGGGGPTSSQSGAVNSEPTTQAVTTSFGGSVGGTLSTDYQATIRSFRGLYLTRTEPGLCRFLFTAWDDANLSWMMALSDLRGVPPEGATYRIEKPRVLFHFEASAETYSQVKESWMGPMGNLGLGGIGQGLLEGSGSTDEQKAQVGVQLRDLVGVDTTARAPEENQSMPATSPFGLEESRTFSTVAGTLDLTFIPGDRAVGQLEIHLESSELDEPPRQPLTFEGSYSLDLVAAQRDGVVNYMGCEPPPFEIKSFYPKDGQQHLGGGRPIVRVDFSAAADPATLTRDTFQLGYRDPSETFVPTAGRILHKDDGAYFAPDRPLLPGVHYKARVKTGNDGARSRAGSPLEDTQGDGWYSWKFTTRVDMVPETGGQQLLACHLFQTARDVPLIVGKPAIARLYAHWEEQPGVHPNDQIKSFEARIVLRDRDGEITSLRHNFIRPNLWSPRGISKKAARHTAQVTGFLPNEGNRGAILATLEVPTWPGETDVAYSTLCPLRLWHAKPTLNIDFVALQLDEWKEDPTLFQAIQPVLQSIADDAVDLIWQLYPFAEVYGGEVSSDIDIGLTSCRCPAEPPSGDPEDASPFLAASGCGLDPCPGWRAIRVDLPGGEDPEGWLNPRDGADVILNGQQGWPGIDHLLRGESSADLIVAFGPKRLFEGGGTGSLLSSGRGVLLASASLESEHYSKFVEIVAHELGHALGLDHLPLVDENLPNALENRARIAALRDGSPPFEYEGIEGLLMTRDGQRYWNKSSQEGNQQEDRLFPLMFPAIVPVDAQFIANHHYRQVQRLLEKPASP